MIELVLITDSNTSLYQNLAEKTINDLGFTYFQKREPLKAIENHLRTIVLTINNELAGYYHLDSEASKVWFGIYVVEKYRGLYLGGSEKMASRYLLSDALKYAIKEKIDLYAMVYKGNIKSFNLLKRANFIVIEKAQGKVFMLKSYYHKK
jgi:hypothetical protein